MRFSGYGLAFSHENGNNAMTAVFIENRRRKQAKGVSGSEDAGFQKGGLFSYQGEERSGCTIGDELALRQ